MMTEPTMPNNYPSEHFTNEGPVLGHDIVAEIDARGVAINTIDAVRADHGRDWWPRTIRQVARGHVPAWPGAVCFPRSTSQVADVLTIAHAHGVPVTAQGGRSGVVGGALVAEGGLALDTTRLNQILDIDEISGTVRVEAGVFGPDLETALNARGFTVGHFPQSFDLATVGGWLACRGAGQFSNRYGKIEDIVRGLTVVLANGDVLTLGGHGPRSAVGPDLVQLFVGSEGTLGVITEATLVMRHVSAHRDMATFSFATFDEGLEACRQMVQHDINPAVLRLYDEIESKRNFEITGNALLILDEGNDAHIAANMSQAKAVCEAMGAEAHSRTKVEGWLAHRNNVSSLTPLWEGGIVVDTIEVAGPWAALPGLFHEVTSALTAIDGMRNASCHQSHAYLDGACLYFTFAGKPASDDEIEAFYRLAWDTATGVVLRHGAALSHHHGVGRNRARFVAEALGAGYGLLRQMKALLDPTNILNPGALGLGGEAW